MPSFVTTPISGQLSIASHGILLMLYLYTGHTKVRLDEQTIKTRAKSPVEYR